MNNKLLFRTIALGLFTNAAASASELPKTDPGTPSIEKLGEKAGCGSKDGCSGKDGCGSKKEKKDKS